MINRFVPILFILFFVLLFLPYSAEAANKSFSITAKQWSFTPSTITVMEGDVVTLNVTSIDVNHGLAISQFGVNISLSPGVTASGTFTADKAGTYSFFCNVSCGIGHSGMRGTLVVQAAATETNTNTSTNSSTNTSTVTNTNTSVNTNQSVITNTSSTTIDTSTPAATDPVAEAEAVNELELNQDEPAVANDSTNRATPTNVSNDISQKTSLPNTNNLLNNIAVAESNASEKSGSSSALGIGLIVVGVVVFGVIILFVVRKKP